jgi:nucleoid-associated protein YgaU
MKRGIAGILIFLLAAVILALPGCTSIQEHWTIPDDQMPAAEAPPEEAPSPGPADQEARRQEDVRLQREEATRREAQAREEARRQEEARLQREEAARRQEEARLQREEAARREAEAREEARKQEEVRRMLEDLEASHRRAEAEEKARQEAESLRSSGEQADAGFKPRYYVVRAGDTFNSIAANPLIYNNRNEWYTLYQANREKMDNPDNPDLLAPGTVIEIPSIAGEAREGTY